MRVLILSDVYAPRIGGIEAFLADELVPELRRRDHEVAVVTGTEGLDVPPGPDEVDGIPVLRTPLHTSAASPAALLRTRRDVGSFIAAFEPEVVHSHDMWFLGWLYGRVAGPSPPPLVTTVHYVMTTHMPASVDLVAKRLEIADWVTGVSRAVLDDVLSYAPSVAARCSVVPNAVRAPRGSEVVGEPADPPTVLCVGRLVEQKGFDRAIAAFGAVASRHPAVRLVIVGDGPLRSELAAQAETVTGSDRIDFVGATDRVGVAEYLRRASVVLMPSRWEGHPLVALEAAWAGRPVIATRCPGGLLDVVVDGETGSVVDEGDADALARALDALLSNGDEARRRGGEARRRAERGPTIAECVDGYETVFRTVGASAR